MLHNCSQEYNKKEYRQHLFPHSVSLTYDKAARELADYLYNRNVSIKDKLQQFEKFAQKFTTGHEAWIEWNNFQCDKLEEDGLYSKEKESELDMKECLNLFQHFPVRYRITKGSITCIPHLGIALCAQRNSCTVVLKTLDENDFNYEDKLSDIYDTFWFRFSNKINSFHTLSWYEINMTRYAGFKRLPEIEKCLKIYIKYMLLDATDNIYVNRFNILKKRISLLKQTEDAEHIIKNIELDMAYQNTTKDLKKKWKLLFHYSHKFINDTNESEKSLTNLLEVYRRYCRYFVDDLITRKKYRKMIAKTENSFDNTKWILDSIKLEFDFGSRTEALKQLIEFAEKRKPGTKIISFDFYKNYEYVQQVVTKPEVPLPMIYFTKNGMVQQSFAFQSPIINYICKNASYEYTQKLQKCSKLMFLIINKTLCFKFSISEVKETEIFQETLFVSAENPKIDHLNNICIFNTLFVSCKNDSSKLSSFIPKIQECKVRFLLIRHQTLSLKEYDFLTKSKNIKRIAFKKSIVKDVNGGRAYLEELMDNLPNADNIGFIPSPLITAETFFILQSAERNVKIQTFYLSSIKEKINAADLCSFFKNHVANNSKIEMYGENEKELRYLIPSINDLLASWEFILERPTIKMEHINLFNVDF